MEYYGNRLCISMRDLVDGGIMSESNYKQLASRGRFDVVRRGGGAKGSYALIALDSIPEKYATKIKNESLTSPFLQWFKENYTLNQTAVEIFASPELIGVKMTLSKSLVLAADASILDLLSRMISSGALINRLFGGKIRWGIICAFKNE